MYNFRIYIFSLGRRLDIKFLQLLGLRTKPYRMQVLFHIHTLKWALDNNTSIDSKQIVVQVSQGN